MDKIDVRGMACPQPVLITKNAIKESPKTLDILVDNHTAIQNISRFLKHSGYAFEVKEMDEDYLICAKK